MSCHDCSKCECNDTADKQERKNENKKKQMRNEYLTSDAYMHGCLRNVRIAIVVLGAFGAVSQGIFERPSVNLHIQMASFHARAGAWRVAHESR